MTDFVSSSFGTKVQCRGVFYSQMLPYFLLNQQLKVVVSSDKKYFNSTVFVHKDFWGKFFCMAKLVVPSKLPIIVDGLQYSSSTNS